MPSIMNKKGAPCRSCGASFAIPGHNRWGICQTCYRRLSRHSEPEDQDFIEFMAKQLNSALKRKKQGKHTVPCQCMSFMGNDRFNRGYQCAAHPSTTRDGRPVCAAHARSESVVFVDEYEGGAYKRWRDVLAEMIDFDPRFAKICEDALEKARAAQPPGEA